MIELHKGFIGIDKSSTERVCIKCGCTINKSRYHLVLDDRKKKYFFQANSRKIRIHFECFENLSKDLIETQNKLDEIKVELITKQL